MNRHLTEDDFIEHLFELDSPRKKRVTRTHLDQCAQCRDGLEKLRGRFAALDVIRQDQGLSEELIRRVIEQAAGKAAGKSVTRKMGRPMVVWLGRFAAVFIIALAIFAVHATRQGHKEMIATRTVQRQASEKRDMDAEPTVGQGASVGSVADDVVAGMYEHETAVAGDIDEKPPFAPASAIELVTLPRREGLQLTIYNSADLTLVRERRNLTMKRGWNWLQFMWSNTLIDPTSLTIRPLENNDKIDVQQLVYPARLKDVARWLIRSQVEGQVPVEITYLTSGLSWRAFYTGTLTPDEEHMHLAGYVRVTNNSGEDYQDAQTRLIVGKVHILDQIADLARRRYPYDRPVDRLQPVDKSQIIRNKLNFRKDVGGLFFGSGIMNGDAYREGLGRKEIKKEGLSEYFLYTIEGTETIPNTWAKRLPSFEADDVPVESLYKYDEHRWGNAARRFVSFANDEEHELGQTPIPGGAIKVYRDLDENHHLSYTGQSSFKYIPVNEKVELNMGSARHVKIEPVLMKLETDNYQYDKSGNISGWDEIGTWQVTTTNTRNLPVKVEVYRNFDTPYWTIENSGDFGEYEKEDADTAKYVFTVKPRTKTQFQYVLTTCRGTRQEDWKE